MGRNQKSATKSSQCQTAGEVNSGVLHEPNFVGAPISSLFALLSFWDLICNDEFNSGSSCLN